MFVVSCSFRRPGRTAPGNPASTRAGVRIGKTKAGQSDMHLDLEQMTKSWRFLKVHHIASHFVDLPWFTVICPRFVLFSFWWVSFSWVDISNTGVGWFGQGTSYDKLICLASTLLSWTAYYLRLHECCMSAASFCFWLFMLQVDNCVYKDDFVVRSFGEFGDVLTIQR